MRENLWKQNIFSENCIQALKPYIKLSYIYIYIYIYSIIIEDQEPFKGFYTNKNLTTYNYYSVKLGVTAGLTVIKNNQGLLILAIRITSRYSSSSSILNFCFCVWHSPLALTTYNYYSVKSGVTAGLTVIKNNQGLVIKLEAVSIFKEAS